MYVLTNATTGPVGGLAKIYRIVPKWRRGARRSAGSAITSMRKTTALGVAAAATLGAWLLAGGGAAQSPPAASGGGRRRMDRLRPSSSLPGSWAMSGTFRRGAGGLAGALPVLPRERPPTRARPRSSTRPATPRFRDDPRRQRVPGDATVAARIGERPEVGRGVRSQPGVPQLTRMPPVLQKITVPYEYPVYFTATCSTPGTRTSSRPSRGGARAPPPRARRRRARRGRRVAGAGRDRRALRRAPRGPPRAGGAAWSSTAARREERPGRCRPADGAPRAPARPPLLRGHRRRRRGARCAGYAAATTTAACGVRVPTTVLAQADSGVGVKNGVNAFGKKNFVGTFAPPFAVLNDRRFLETPRRARHDRRDGRGGEGGADPRPGFFAWLGDARRRARGLRRRAR